MQRALLANLSVVCAEGFDGLDTVPSAFVLMGNFQSQPATTASTDYTVIKEQFKSLANVISQYQRLQVGQTSAAQVTWLPIHISAIITLCMMTITDTPCLCPCRLR